MPQNMWGQLLAPSGQVRFGRVLESTSQGVVANPTRGAVGVLPLGGKQRGAGAGVVVVKLAPDVLAMTDPVNIWSLSNRSCLIPGERRARGYPCAPRDELVEVRPLVSSLVCLWRNRAHIRSNYARKPPMRPGPAGGRMTVA